MSKTKEILPYGWRKKVAETLTSKGCPMNSQQVADVLRGRFANIEVYNKVVAERKKLAKQHEMLLKRIGKVAAFFLGLLWLI